MYAGYVQYVYVVARICEHVCVCVFWPVRAWECGEGFLWYFKCLLLNITTRDHDQTPDTPPLLFLIHLSLVLLLNKNETKEIHQLVKINLQEEAKHSHNQGMAGVKS